MNCGVDYPHQQRGVLKDSISCSAQWLADQVSAGSDRDGGNNQTGNDVEQSSVGGRVLPVDCRPSESYLSVHVKNAANLALPTIMLRRFVKGQMSVDAVANHVQQQRQQRVGNDGVIVDLRRCTLVFYDDSTSLPVCNDVVGSDATNGNMEAVDRAPTGTGTSAIAQQQSLVIALAQRFRQQGYDAVLLDGGLEDFRQQFQHLCSTADDQLDSVTTSVNRMSVGDDDVISTRSAGTRPAAARQTTLSKIHIPKFGQQVPGDDESSLSNQLRRSGPTIVLPYLYIGNAQNSQDFQCLQQHGIQYILNVTQNIPNKFEDNCDIHYLRIPISDHWSQNLSTYLPKAVRFIDDARTSKRGVLVHCLAGISRSVTVTVAYLMASHSLSLELAYDHVKRCRPTASPSLNFMGQLMDFEATLDPDRPRSLCCRHLANYSVCTEQVSTSGLQAQQAAA